MAYSTILKPSDYFNTKIYTGNGNVGTALTTGTFQPDFCWFKNRGTVENHVLINAIRGASYNLASNLNRAETNISDKVSAFTSTGVTLGSSAETNENGQPLVAWNWKANGAGSANTQGSINSTVSVNTTSGFSIVKYSGNSSSTSTIGHGLGVAPSLVIIKNLGQAEEWAVGVNAGSLDFTQYAYLNLNNAFSGNAAAFFNNTNPSSSLIYIGNSGTVNGGSSYDHIAYCFSNVQGFSRIGSYNGNGNATNPPFIYTGFKPAFVMLKVTNSADSWNMYDNRRLGYNGTGGRLKADSTVVEAVGSAYQLCNFYSNGFSPQGSDGTSNGTSKTYIYLAFAESPFVANSGESIPTTAK